MDIPQIVIIPKKLEEAVQAEVEEAVEYAKAAPFPPNESALEHVFWKEES